MVQNMILKNRIIYKIWATWCRDLDILKAIYLMKISALKRSQELIFRKVCFMKLCVAVAEILNLNNSKTVEKLQKLANFQINNFQSWKNYSISGKCFTRSLQFSHEK